MLPGMPDFGEIFQQAQQMQQQMETAQRALAGAELVGSAGGGVVTAVVDGNGELKAVDMDAAVVDPADIETLADLIVAAVRDASRQAAELREQTMNPMAGGLADSLSGLGLALPGFRGPALDGSDEDEDEDDEDEDEDEDDDLCAGDEDQLDEDGLDDDELIIEVTDRPAAPDERAGAAGGG